MPPATRIWARLDRFAVACPSCGGVIVTHGERRQLPARLDGDSRRRYEAKERPTTPSTRKLRWNPYTQRLKCPHCGVAHHVGLVLYSVRRLMLTAPSDTIPNAHERAELRSLGGGWYLDRPYEQEGQPVNLAVDVPCSCPPRGWAVTCAVHGDPAAGAHGV
jgi:predicted RNA-binding Zn-ribbon protein involved in translation (DUF1610 family)